MGLIPEEIITQVVDRCDIVETVASYIPLKRAGKNFKANCPFHQEKTPSFFVNPDKQIFHCFGCGAGGNAVTFVMKQERLDFPEAVRLLASRVNVEIPQTEERGPGENLRRAVLHVNELAAEYFTKNLLSDKSSPAQKARAYLKDRGTSLETAKKFRLGFALDRWDGLLEYLKKKDVSLSLMEKAGLILPQESRQGFYDRFRNRVIFPIFDTRGQCRAFGARTLEKDKQAKYINSPETILYTKGHYLYGFHLAKETVGREDFVIIVEGYMDCLTAFQAGVTNVVASLGTALTTEQIRFLRRYTKNVIMLFDTDQAGESAMMRSFDTLVEEGLSAKVAHLKEGEDPDSFIRHYGVEAFREKISQARMLFDYKLKVLTETFDAKTIEGKAKISAGMLETINKFDNEVVRTEYIKKLSRALMVSEPALKAEIKKLKRGSTPRYAKKQTNRRQKPLDPSRRVEYDILRLLLVDEAFIPETKKQILLSDFQDERVRDVISKMYEWFEQGKEVSGRKLLNSFDDEELQHMISSLTVNEDILADKQRMHRDYIVRLKQDRLKTLRQDILVQMKDAEDLGDQKKLEHLRNRFSQLISQK